MNDAEKRTKTMEYEEYRLVLTHTYVDGNGERMALEDPVEVVQMFPSMENRRVLPVSVCINDMMDRMKEYILRKVGE